MNTAYSYIRFSTPEQAAGDSLRRQTEATARYCERNGLTLDTSLTLRDLGVSAFRSTNAKDGSLSAFLSAIERGRIAKGSTLIVESLDRLSRDEIEEALDLFRKITKSGINIVTLSPEYRFEAGKLDMTAYMMAIVSMSRAHEESLVKSTRIKQAWANKFRCVGEKKLTARCPGWLRLSDDRKSFDVLPGPAAIVKRIFQMATDGYGTFVITKTLNTEGIENFGRVNTWGQSYIIKILRSRAVIGDFIPHKNSQYEGKPIPKYYPAIVGEDVFYKVQAALTAREKKPGRRGPKVSNLFTGLVYDSADGGSMIMANKVRADKSRTYRLVSAKAMHGVRGSTYTSIPYQSFEDCMLGWLKEISPADILPYKANGNENAARLTEAETNLAKVTEKISKTQKAMTGDMIGNFDALIEVLKELQTQRDRLTTQVEGLRGEVHSAKDDNLSESVSLWLLLRQAEPSQLADLRTRLRARLASLISEIWVDVTVPQRTSRALRIQVHFRAGGVRRFKVLITKQHQYIAENHRHQFSSETSIHSYSMETADFGGDIRYIDSQAVAVA